MSKLTPEKLSDYEIDALEGGIQFGPLSARNAAQLISHIRWQAARIAELEAKGAEAEKLLNEAAVGLGWVNIGTTYEEPAMKTISCIRTFLKGESK